MDIQTETKGNTAVLRLSGQLIAQEEQAFRLVILALDAQGAANIVMDMTQVTFIDSRGVGMLISAMKNMRQKGGDLSIFGIQKPVMAMFELSQLHLVFRIYATEERALKTLSTMA